MSGFADNIDKIRLNYRLAKFAEKERSALDQKLVSFGRIHLTNWLPDMDEKGRKRLNTAALQAVKEIQKGIEADPEKLSKVAATLTSSLHEDLAPMVIGLHPARQSLEMERKQSRKRVESSVKSLPAWERLKHIKGFSVWHLGCIIGEFGDLTDDIVPTEAREPGKRYSGVRRIYKRFGLAPDSAYPRGEKRTGAMVPRSTRGRIIGIIFDPLLKHQWAAERGPNGEKLKESEKGRSENIPAHPTGPYGVVYGETKARQLAAGRSNGHAFALARRTMVKALIHDVHKAWHGQPLTYQFEGSAASHVMSASRPKFDRRAPDFERSRPTSHGDGASHIEADRRAAIPLITGPGDVVGCNADEIRDQLENLIETG